MTKPEYTHKIIPEDGDEKLENFSLDHATAKEQFDAALLGVHEDDASFHDIVLTFVATQKEETRYPGPAAASIVWLYSDAGKRLFDKATDALWAMQNLTSAWPEPYWRRIMGMFAAPIAGMCMKYKRVEDVPKPQSEDLDMLSHEEFSEGVAIFMANQAQAESSDVTMRVTGENRVTLECDSAMDLALCWLASDLGKPLFDQLMECFELTQEITGPMDLDILGPHLNACVHPLVAFTQRGGALPGVHIETEDHDA